MRYIATVLVVLVVVLAGCNTGATGGTPTAETTIDGTEDGTATENGSMTPTVTETGEMSTATPTDDTTGDGATGNDTDGEDTTQSGVDASEVPGMEGSQLTNSTALLITYYESVLTGPTAFGTTYEGNSEATTVGIDRLDYQLRNDTRQQLYVENISTRQRTTYVDGAKAAVRNDTTGEIRYSNDSNFVGQGTGYLAATFTGFTLNFIYALNWEATDTTTVDGEDHYVLEPTGLNETRLRSVPVSAENVTAVDGRLVVGTDGVIHTGDVDLEGPADVRVTYSLQTDDGIDVTAPSWYDESKAS